MPQISAQQHQEGRIVEEYGALPRALAAHRQVLVVGGQVQILDVGAERFAGPQARGMDQPEQHPIAQIRDNAHWSKKPSADSGGRRNTSRREWKRSSVLSVAGSGRWRALVRAGMPTRQGRCASLRDRPAAGP